MGIRDWGLGIGDEQEVTEEAERDCRLRVRQWLVRSTGCEVRGARYGGRSSVYRTRMTSDHILKTKNVSS